RLSSFARNSFNYNSLSDFFLLWTSYESCIARFEACEIALQIDDIYWLSQTLHFMTYISRLRAVVLFLIILPLSGCLWRNHIPVQTLSTAPLQTATQEHLIDYVNTQAANVQSMNATVDIDTTVGGEKKGRVTDYQQI